MNRRLFYCLLALLCALPGSASAWGALGHRAVAALAERHLDPQAHAQVQALLAGEPDPTLAGVAMWADDQRNADPERFKQTSRWHYINAKGGGCAFDLPRDCPGGDCVVSAIEHQLAILRDRSQPALARREALKYVVHFVGDVHQPMHAGSRTDAGGNGFQVSLRTDIEPEAYARKQYVDGVMGTNLHSVWDYYLLASLREPLPQFTDRLDALPWPPMPDAPASPPLAWAKESCRLIDARNIYPQTHKMDHVYLDTWRPLAEQRVRQAAWRLATLLNQALDHPGPGTGQ